MDTYAVGTWDIDPLLSLALSTPGYNAVEM